MVGLPLRPVVMTLALDYLGSAWAAHPPFLDTLYINSGEPGRYSPPFSVLFSAFSDPTKSNPCLLGPYLANERFIHGT